MVSWLVRCSPYTSDLAKTICLNKARNTKDAFSAGPKKVLVPHTSTTHPPAIEALQFKKITKLGLLSLPLLVFNIGLTASEIKSTSMLSPPGKLSRIAELEL